MRLNILVPIFLSTVNIPQESPKEVKYVYIILMFIMIIYCLINIILMSRK